MIKDQMRLNSFKQLTVKSQKLKILTETVAMAADMPGCECRSVFSLGIRDILFKQKVYVRIGNKHMHC